MRIYNTYIPAITFISVITWGNQLIVWLKILCCKQQKASKARYKLKRIHFQDSWLYLTGTKGRDMAGPWEGTRVRRGKAAGNQAVEVSWLAPHLPYCMLQISNPQTNQMRVHPNSRFPEEWLTGMAWWASFTLWRLFGMPTMENVGSMSPSLESGQACDGSDQWSMAGVRLCDFRGWGIEGCTVSGFVCWDILTCPIRSPTIVGLPCFEEAQAMWKDHAATLAKIPAEPRLQVIPAQVPDMWVKKPSDDSSPIHLSGS